MFCTNCGKELNGGEFCTNCGAKIAPAVNTQSQSYDGTVNYPTPRPAAGPANKKTLFAIVGGIAALLIIALVLTHGKDNGKNTVPHYSEPYNYSQGYSVPYSYYSNDFSGYPDFDADNSYDYGSTSQICPSCFGSGTCPICHGTGQYSMYGNDYSECTACGGTGVCSICGGDGIC
ncbi:MAG: hypothetical protein VB064_02605 [Oscillospiraceae bacterium]|nr:hypothetical protein [Oscillospiraceae bacterium]